MLLHRALLHSRTNRRPLASHSLRLIPQQSLHGALTWPPTRPILTHKPEAMPLCLLARRRPRLEHPEPKGPGGSESGHLGAWGRRQNAASPGAVSQGHPSWRWPNQLSWALGCSASSAPCSRCCWDRAGGRGAASSLLRGRGGSRRCGHTCEIQAFRGHGPASNPLPQRKAGRRPRAGGAAGEEAQRQPCWADGGPAPGGPFPDVSPGGGGGSGDSGESSLQCCHQRHMQRRTEKDKDRKQRWECSRRLPQASSAGAPARTLGSGLFTVKQTPVSYPRSAGVLLSPSVSPPRPAPFLPSG